MHPFFAGLRPTLHIAHRGGVALAPENTMPAFELAASTYRTDMLEIDVHATRDGVVVVSHDPTLDRCTDAHGPVAALTLAEIRDIDAGWRFTPDDGRTFPYRGRGVRIPVLTDVLRAFPKMRFNIEVKPDDPGAVPLVVDVLTSSGALDRVCIGSESDTVAEAIVRRAPSACFFYPRGALTDLVMRLRGGAGGTGDGPYHVLDMPLFYEGMRLIDAPFLERVRELGRWVNVWVIDDPAEMRALIAEGVGGIMTDRPDLLRDVLDHP